MSPRCLPTLLPLASPRPGTRKLRWLSPPTMPTRRLRAVPPLGPHPRWLSPPAAVPPPAALRPESARDKGEDLVRVRVRVGVGVRARVRVRVRVGVRAR
eukprot:scaffold2399_cov30-Phaeocystis_antarctica.AAC.1